MAKICVGKKHTNATKQSVVIVKMVASIKERCQWKRPKEETAKETQRKPQTIQVQDLLPRGLSQISLNAVDAPNSFCCTKINSMGLSPLICNPAVDHPWCGNHDNGITHSMSYQLRKYMLYIQNLHTLVVLSLSMPSHHSLHSSCQIKPLLCRIKLIIILHT